MPDERNAWEIPIEVLKAYFSQAKERLKKENPPTQFNWSDTVLSEIAPNVDRSLHGKFPACDPEFSAIKIGALYTFWIAKLKPGFGLERAPLDINEYLALKTGLSIIDERLDIKIKLSDDEILEICDTLRYHTTSPNSLTLLFSAWTDREKVRSEQIKLAKQLNEKS